MAFPTTITTAGLNRGCIGPFVSSSGNIYVGMLSSDSYNIQMFKATDPSSSFAGAGIDVTTGSGTDECHSISGAQEGDEIHVVSKNGVSGGTTVDIRYHVFDMSSDTWTTSNTLVKSNMTLGVGNDGLLADVDIAVRQSDGAVFIIYNGAAELVTGTLYERVFYARNLAGAWTADFALGTSGVTQNWRGGKAVVAGDRISFFFQNISTFNLFERTLNSSNVLESLSASVSAPIGAFEGCEQRGTYLSATGVVHFPFQQNTNRLDSVNFTAADTASLAVDTDITGAINLITAPFHHIASMAPHGNTAINAFINDAGDIYTQTKVGGAAWGAPTLHTTCSASAIYVNAYTRSSALVLGMVYLDSGDHFYNELTLSSIAAGGGTVGVPNGFALMGVGR